MLPASPTARQAHLLTHVPLPVLLPVPPACRYTGEDGFELSIPNDKAVEVCDALHSDERVRLCGLGPRDSLRLEAGLCLYGEPRAGRESVLWAGGVGWGGVGGGGVGWGGGGRGDVGGSGVCAWLLALPVAFQPPESCPVPCNFFELFCRQRPE